VLRYAGTWETLKDVRTYVDAMTAATARRLEFLSGKQEAIKAECKPKSDDAFDVKKEAYLASVKEHKSHKTWLASSLALREFYTASQIAQQDYFDGANPVKLAEPAFAPNGTKKPYSLEEIGAMLKVLSEPSATAVATAAFTGLRSGTIAPRPAQRFSDRPDRHAGH
jgi:hypothetical protein